MVAHPPQIRRTRASRDGPPHAGLVVVLSGASAALPGPLMMAGGVGGFGRLGGDVRWESGNARASLPLASMLLPSIALGAAARLVRRFF